MRISALFPVALFCVAMASSLRAQDPGAQQDAEAAREKLLKASDQLDNIQANSETTRVAVEGMKTDIASLQQTVTRLQSDNSALKQQLADLQSAFDQYKADQTKERQTLIDNVAAMIANAKSTRKKKDVAETSNAPADPQPSSEVHSTMEPTAPGLAPPPDNSAGDSGGDTAPPPPRKEKGFYHVVASGETVSMIAAAFRDQGVKVTASQIRKANGLTPDSVLKAGEKLFIPKPGA